MPTLLDLPFELRIRIINYVVESPFSPSPNPFKAKEADAIEYHDLQYRSWSGGSDVVYPQSHHHFFSSACLPLFLTSHQLYTDTQDVLTRLSNTDYVVDIAVENDFKLFVTWLSVPRLTSHISTLQTNIRLFGHIIEKQTARQQLGDGGRRGFHWHFYAVLERILQYGPVGLKKRPGEEPPKYRWKIKNFEDRKMFIDKLVLDFQADELDYPFPAKDVTFAQWWSRHWGRDEWEDEQQMEAFSASKTRPEWLCTYLEDWIAGLLGMSYHYSGYGSVLYERIGRIRMLVDGKFHCEIELTNRLARMQFSDPSSMMGHLPTNEREAGFASWKTETLARREAHGFVADVVKGQ